MKQLLVEPEGWPCTLEECRPGFFVYKDNLCFKSEYGGSVNCEAFVGSGEYLSAGGLPHNEIIVQPVVECWSEVEI